ncbi:MAG: PAS domain-containing protein [Tissierellia bacterium]|nr:PAS domain-containing protein [Tissierellia bacterium]
MSFLSKNQGKWTPKPKKTLLLEEDLDQLRDNFSHVQKLTNIGTWTYLIDRDEVLWSEGIYKILGVDTEKLQGKLEDFYRFIYPQDLEKVAEYVSYAMEGKEYDIEFKIIDDEGKIKYLRERTRVILDGEKKASRIIGIIQDITEFKVVEENLRAFSKDLINAHRISGLGSWRYDFKEKKFYGTNELFRIYDIEPEDMKKDFEDLMKIIHPKDRPRVIEAMKKYTMGDAISIEFRVIQKDGSYKYVLVKGEPRYDKDGQVVEIFGIVQDLTENKILEEKLMKSYNIIAQAEALANIGSWEMDIESNHLVFSDEAMRIYGFNPEKFDNTYEGFLKIVHPDDLFIFHDLFGCPPKDPFNLEFRFIKPDGSIGWIYQRVEFILDEAKKPRQNMISF